MKIIGSRLLIAIRFRRFYENIRIRIRRFNANSRIAITIRDPFQGGFV
jgi:hypothetical protein